MTIRILTLALLLLPIFGSAQNIGYADLKHKLAAADSITGAKVHIIEKANLQTVFSNKMITPVNHKVKIFRIRIFFDNSQHARYSAIETEARFRELFPDIPVNVSHESPYFKVTVGQCLTEEEALVIWGRIKQDFDKAFIMREDVPLSALAKAVPPVLTAPEQEQDSLQNNRNNLFKL